MTDPEDLSDDDLLQAVEDTYRDSLLEDDQLDRMTKFNEFHTYRKEAADRGLRDDASAITQMVRDEIQASQTRGVLGGGGLACLNGH